MKSKDILLLLKMVSLEQSSHANEPHQYSVRALAQATGISKSELNQALNRCIHVGLVARDRPTNLPRVNRRALLGFLREGIKYVFPASLGPVVRGIPTAFAAPTLVGKVMSAGDLLPVWPDAKATDMGQGVEPLCKAVPAAAAQDEKLYKLLALVDAIRLGRPREAKVASDMLKQEFSV
ncbi:hypothetical protein [Gilvimarinus sp. 1_MG-2023]|uniref:hypothetical protein n=1 Tax=Gilvimarinus sp. 1_MG-2023 TaxID=3062638 RepID=UPI0026E3A70A|nr:hypothetical protein [Gilvimarinus sp. 1_MG-2023]MDO6748040.1 hypothetical protein [Gilvimarinus sp. 1_MG-2023]